MMRKQLRHYSPTSRTELPYVLQYDDQGSLCLVGVWCWRPPGLYLRTVWRRGPAPRTPFVDILIKAAKGLPMEEVKPREAGPRRVDEACPVIRAQHLTCP
jgi:hypothetical protein